MSQSLFREWLPPPVADEALRREGALFGTLFRALAADWEASADLPSAERSQASLRWISMINRRAPRCPARVALGPYLHACIGCGALYVKVTGYCCLQAPWLLCTD